MQTMEAVDGTEADQPQLKVIFCFGLSAGFMFVVYPLDLLS